MNPPFHPFRYVSIAQQFNLIHLSAKRERIKRETDFTFQKANSILSY